MLMDVPRMFQITKPKYLDPAYFPKCKLSLPDSKQPILRNLLKSIGYVRTALIAHKVNARGLQQGRNRNLNVPVPPPSTILTCLPQLVVPMIQPLPSP